MLVEFSVKNFRSIKERQTFSMAADKPHKEHRCVLNSGFNAVPQLVEASAIYGPNGSGKSNIVMAMNFFRIFVRSSSNDRYSGQKIDFNPFLFSEETSQEPTEFEIVFIHKGYLFQYGFSVTDKIVRKEWLYATPQSAKKQSPQRWYERNEENHKKDSYIRKEIKGQKESWKANTRDNALFLSTAVQLNSEDFRIPFEWISEKFCVMPNVDYLKSDFTKSEILDNSEKKASILKFMKGLDVSFDDVSILQREIAETDLKDIPDVIKTEILKDLVGHQTLELYSIYKFDNGKEYTLPFDKESDGTKRLFAYAGPILDIINNGYVLIADELNKSLHPLALKGIVSLFGNPEINTNNAQLVFTTHDTSIMNMLDRDQIWLMDKNRKCETTLSALSDFEGRADEAIEKRYLGGRYGSLPVIGDIF